MPYASGVLLAFHDAGNFVALKGGQYLVGTFGVSDMQFDGQGEDVGRVARALAHHHRNAIGQGPRCPLEAVVFTSNCNTRRLLSNHHVCIEKFLRSGQE